MSRFRLLKLASSESPIGKAGYALKDEAGSRRPLMLDFQSAKFTRRLKSAGKKTELVARAMKAGAGVNVLDCTAGLGRDGFLLAYLGCQVIMMERSMVLAVLLEDALQRAAADPLLAPAVDRITLIRGESAAVLQGTGRSFDAIYLDPMFPETTTSALVKGEMQTLQEFIGEDEDAGLLLNRALQASVTAGSGRVVMKRPARARLGRWEPPQPPTHRLSSKGINFEIYITAAGPASSR